MRISPVALLLLPLLLVGCPKKDDKPVDGDKSGSDPKADKASDKKKKKAAADDDDDDKSAKKDKGSKAADEGDDDPGKGKGGNAPAKAAGSRTIGGVDVPRWAPEPVRKDKCKPSDDDQKKLARLMKGEEPSITDGSMDAAGLATLQSDVSSDCALAVPRLAVALNSGGFMHYQKKKYDEANRWWTRALAIDPALDVARYNLACGLALDGKDADAVWNFQQLAAAADEGDAGASNYLDKAKTDKDADSLRDEAGFTEALTHAKGGLVGPRKEPEIATALPALLPKDWREGEVSDGMNEPQHTTFKPTLVDVWTWRPDADTELLVGRVVQDPSMIGKIGKQDFGWDVPETWGGIVVLRIGDDKKVEVLHAHQLPNNAPHAVAAGKNGSVTYTFFYGQQGGQAVDGRLLWKNGKVEAHDPTLDGA